MIANINELVLLARQADSLYNEDHHNRADALEKLHTEMKAGGVTYDDLRLSPAQISRIEGQPSLDTIKKAVAFLGTIPKVSLNIDATLQFANDLAFAERTNQVEGLLEQFRRLQGLAVNCHAIAYVSTDFAPHSFYFNIFPDSMTLDEASKNWQTTRIMNGGVIYHGALEDGSRGETFSVQLVPTDSWQIHT